MVQRGVLRPGLLSRLLDQAFIRAECDILHGTSVVRTILVSRTANPGGFAMVQRETLSIHKHSRLLSLRHSQGSLVSPGQPFEPQSGSDFDSDNELC